MVLDLSDPLNIIDLTLKISALTFALIYLALILRLYRQKPTRVRKVLIFVFICFICLTFLYVIYYFIPIENIFDIFYSFIILLISSINLSVLYFATEVFGTEQSARKKRMNYVYAAALLLVAAIISFFSAISFTDPSVEPILDIMQVVYLFLSLGFLVYLINHAYKLSFRIAKHDQDQAKYKRSVLHIGNFALMLLLVYVFLAIDSQLPGFTIYGRLIWVFIILAMFFVFMGFIRPALKSEPEE